jgi:hypothetical protein
MTLQRFVFQELGKLHGCEVLFYYVPHSHRNLRDVSCPELGESVCFYTQCYIDRGEMVQFHHL